MVDSLTGIAALARNILINHELAGDHLLEKLTQEEIDILNALLSRPILPMPPINKNEPRCNVCGEQPANERDGSLPLCDSCYKSMIGHADEFFRDGLTIAQPGD